MRKSILFILLCCCHPCFAQDYPFNDTAWWQKLVYETATKKKFSPADTCVIVASNRYKTDNALRFMSEVRGDGQMLYFFVYAHKGQWHVLEVNSLEDAINYMPDKNRDWVVYTEGMGKIFTSELNRGMLMAAQYGVNVLMLDYPSITTTKRQLGNYLFSIYNAKTACKDHVPVLKTIKEEYTAGRMGDGNMTLFFHSMGNYLLQQTVKQRRLHLLNDTLWADNIVLNAACVPQKGHAKWLNKIDFAQHIYVHYNPGDKTLYWPELFNKQKQLGRKLRGALSNKAHYINFHPLVQEQHSYFLSFPGRSPVGRVAREHYNNILHGKPVNLESRPYQPSAYQNRGVDILPD